MEMAFVTVTEPRPHVKLITLNRPERLNAMSFDVVLPLYEAFREVGSARRKSATAGVRQLPNYSRSGGKSTTIVPSPYGISTTMCCMSRIPRGEVANISPPISKGWPARGWPGSS